MARKKRQRNADDIMDTIALLPWWLGVALAIASYVGFHWLATRPLPVSEPGQIGASLVPIYGVAIAGAMQLAVPILCVAAAFGSYLTRKKRANLVTKAGKLGSDPK